MLTLIRLATAAISWVLLTIAIALCISLTAGIVAGVQGYQPPKDGAKQTFQDGFKTGYDSGQERGKKLAQEWGPAILLGSAAAGGALAIWLCWGGILPWCRSWSGSRDSRA